MGVDRESLSERGRETIFLREERIIGEIERRQEFFQDIAMRASRAAGNVNLPPEERDRASKLGFLIGGMVIGYEEVLGMIDPTRSPRKPEDYFELLREAIKKFGPGSTSIEDSRLQE